MEYIYPPVYKYITLFVIIFLFLSFYKNISSDKFLLFAFVITMFIIAIDYIIVYNQPPLSQFKINDEEEGEEVY